MPVALITGTSSGMGLATAVQTAKALGLTIPQELLLRADELIE